MGRLLSERFGIVWVYYMLRREGGEEEARGSGKVQKWKRQGRG